MEEINASAGEMTASLTQLAHESEAGSATAGQIEKRAIRIQSEAQNSQREVDTLSGEISQKLNKAIQGAHEITRGTEEPVRPLSKSPVPLPDWLKSHRN